MAIRFFTAVVLIAVLSAAAEYFLPWWSIAIVAFVISFLMKLRPGRAFLAGFLGVGVCWLAFAVWQDMANEHILSTRMAALFHLPNYNLFIVVTVFTGALVGGLAAWAGAASKPHKPLSAKVEASI